MSLSDSKLMQLGRTSRRAAALSGLGAGVMLVSLCLASLALRDQVGAKRALLATLDAQRLELTSSINRLATQRQDAERAFAESRSKLAIVQRQAEAAQDDVADLNAVLDATGASSPIAQPVSARERARAEWRAGLAARNKNDPAAAAHFKAAVDADPSYAPAYNSLGRVEADKGNSHTAEQLYRQSLRHDPTYRAALYNLAKLTEKTDGAKAALAPAQELLKLRPSDARSQQLVQRLSATAIE